MKETKGTVLDFSGGTVSVLQINNRNFTLFNTMSV